jgi:hypothetical protein
MVRIWFSQILFEQVYPHGKLCKAGHDMYPTPGKDKNQPRRYQESVQNDAVGVGQNAVLTPI